MQPESFYSNGVAVMASHEVPGVLRTRLLRFDLPMLIGKRDYVAYILEFNQNSDKDDDRKFLSLELLVTRDLKNNEVTLKEDAFEEFFKEEDYEFELPEQTRQWITQIVEQNKNNLPIAIR